MKKAIDLILSDHSGEIVTDYAIEKMIEVDGTHYAKATHPNDTMVFVRIVTASTGEMELEDITDKQEYLAVTQKFSDIPSL